jgi:hypothetical protein
MLLSFDTLKLPFVNYAPNCTKILFHTFFLTPLANLRPLIFGLTLSGWFTNIKVLFFFSWREYDFRFTPTFSATQVERKTRCLSWLLVFPSHPYHVSRLRISGAIPLLHIHAFTAWTGTATYCLHMRFRSYLHVNPKNNAVKCDKTSFIHTFNDPPVLDTIPFQFTPHKPITSQSIVNQGNLWGVILLLGRFWVFLQSYQ